MSARHVTATGFLESLTAGVILPTRTTPSEVLHAFDVSEQAWGRFAAATKNGGEGRDEAREWMKASVRAHRLFWLLQTQDGPGRSQPDRGLSPGDDDSKLAEEAAHV